MIPIIQNIELEKSVIASAMTSGKALHELSTKLDASDFSDLKLGRICEELKKCSSKGYDPDVTIMIPKLGEDYIETFSRILGGGIHTATGTSDNISNHCRKLKEISTARQLVSKAYNILASAVSVTDYSDFVQKSVYEIANISTDHKGGRLNHISSYFGDAIKDFEDVQSKKEVGVRTGICDIDNTTNGFRKGELVIVAGRPAQGKTSLVLSMIKNMMLSGKKIGVFSLEMRASELIHKLVSMVSTYEHEIPLGVFRGSLPMSSRHAESFGNSMNILSQSQIFINESPYTTMIDIETELRRFTRQNELDIVFVDYMSLIADESGGGRARHEQIQDYSMRFKRLAKSLSIPIVLLSQIKNDSYNKKPTMADISESTQLSRDADMIYLIWKPIESDNTRKVIIGEKGRSVSGGNFCVYFSQSTTEFSSMTEHDAIQFKNEFAPKKEDVGFR